MKLILILSLLCSTLVVESEKQKRRICHITDPNVKQVPSCDDNQRSPPEPTLDEWDDEEWKSPPERYHWDKDHEEICDKDCSDTCPHLKTVKPIELFYTSEIEQSVSLNTVLKCTPDSYFTRIEYHGNFDDKLSCFGLDGGCDGKFPGLYVGYKNLPGGKEEKIALNAQNYCGYQSFINGNSQVWEKTKLEESHCSGDVLTTSSDWVADDPLTGCCSSGVNHLTALTYNLKIFGKCCSLCNLQQSEAHSPKKVSNSK